MSSQLNQSLQNGLDCLTALVMAEAPVGSREIARRLGMEPTKVNRLLKTMSQLGLAGQTDKKKYIPGPGLHVLSAMSLRGSQLLLVALPHLQQLSKKLDCPVALGVLWKQYVCYIYHGHHLQSVEAAIVGHHLYPAQDSSIGRVLLAEYTNDEIKRQFQAKSSDEPDLDWSTFLREINATRTRGYGFSKPGTSCAVTVGRPAIAGLAILSDKPIEDNPSQLPALRMAQEAITQVLAETFRNLGIPKAHS